MSIRTTGHRIYISKAETIRSHALIRKVWDSTKTNCSIIHIPCIWTVQLHKTIKWDNFSTNFLFFHFLLDCTVCIWSHFSPHGLFIFVLKYKLLSMLLAMAKVCVIFHQITFYKIFIFGKLYHNCHCFVDLKFLCAAVNSHGDYWTKARNARSIKECLAIFIAMRSFAKICFDSTFFLCYHPFSD